VFTPGKPGNDFYRFLIFNQDYMKQYCTRIYRQLQQELAQCEKKNLSFHKEIECCFLIANKYWNRVKEKLNTYEFATEEKEIEFFKLLKPKFTSGIEYYCFVYHATLFAPTDFDAAFIFWSREHKRLQKFQEDNKDFLLCFEGSEMEMTPYYFLRKYFLCENIPGLKMYDAGAIAITNGDPLAATLLALRRYIPYVEKKMATL
jgi:hypothetical protein